jgi:putative NIF3 family GTP cyclohydrolase 1 type 2
MLVLLDQGAPAPLRRHLSHHIVKTATQQGWATLANGDLLTAAEAEGFDVFVTTDRNLRYQQNLTSRRIAIVVIAHAQWPGLEPHVALVVAAIDNAIPGTYAVVEIPIGGDA